MGSGCYCVQSWDAPPFVSLSEGVASFSGLVCLVTGAGFSDMS